MKDVTKQQRSTIGNLTIRPDVIASYKTKILTPNELMKIFGISRTILSKWVLDLDFPEIRVGNCRRYYWASVEKWISKIENGIDTYKPKKLVQWKAMGSDIIINEDRAAEKLYDADEDIYDGE